MSELSQWLDESAKDPIDPQSTVWGNMISLLGAEWTGVDGEVEQ